MRFFVGLRNGLILSAVIWGLLLCSLAFAVEITVPDGISEQEAKVWMAELQEQKVMMKINSDPVIIEKTTAAREEIDTYRKSLGLAPKFEKVAEPVTETREPNTGE